MRPLSIRAVARPAGCLQMNSEILRNRLRIVPWSLRLGAACLSWNQATLRAALSFEICKEFRRPVSCAIANARAGQGFVATEAT